MKSSKILLCGLVMSFGFLWVSSAEIHGPNTNGECSKLTHTTCPCGKNGGVVMVPVKLCTAKDPFTGKKVCRPCVGDDYNEHYCNKFENCETCVSGMKKCLTCPLGKTGPWCTEKQDPEQAINMYPIIIRIPRGGYPPHEKNRHVRAISETCSVPDSMETVEIDCTIWPRHIKCKEICIFGYTFQENPTRELTCKFEEDVWQPSEFAECKPFIDCTVHLISAGDVFCTAGKMKTGTTCDITCLEDEEREKIPKAQYECKSDGTWDPPLPFCVEKGNKDSTVAPPPMK